MEIPSGFPEVLRPALPAEPSRNDQALIGDPSLLRFWNALADHVEEMAARGWRRDDAAGVLTGCVFVPLAMGYDFGGTLPRRIREGVNMDRRKKAAALALDLAELLDEIGREPLPPDGLHVSDLLPLLPHAAPDGRSKLGTSETRAALINLAAALEVPPDFAAVPGLASRKPGWRGFIREVRASLGQSGFLLRERDAVALVAALARSEGKVSPSRESVAHALRAAEAEAE